MSKNVGFVKNRKQGSMDANMDDYIENILAENMTLKQKLDSKCQAISILNLEVEKLKMEIGRKKEIIDELKAKQLCHTLEQETIHSDSSRSLRLEIDSLRQKLRDALGDVQALRYQMNIENKTDSSKSDPCGLLYEEKLVGQLEAIQRSKMQLECDLKTLLDEKEELVTERDAYKCKLHRLNHECNVLLNGNAHGLIDLDALVMENRLLQERLIQAREESQLAKQVSDRYKTLLLTKKKSGGGDVESSNRMLLTQKQVRELVANCEGNNLINGDAGLAEVKSLCLTLLDSLGDKTLALQHQKRANRILAARIAELQQRMEASLPSSSTTTEFPSRVLLEGYKTLVDAPQQGASIKMLLDRFDDRYSKDR